MLFAASKEQFDRSLLTLSDGAKAFLPSCVPDLQFDSFVIQLYLLDLEVNSTKQELLSYRYLTQY